MFFFHGAGGTNAGWGNKLKDIIHDGSSSFIGLYPQGVNNQWNTGSQSGNTAQMDDVLFTKTVLSDVLGAFYNWNANFVSL